MTTLTPSTRRARSTSRQRDSEATFQWPLTNSGKIDRKLLPAPDQNLLSTGTVYAGARNDKETSLLIIWENVLRRTGIGIYDNFFQTGGDSIKAIQVTSRLSATGWQLSMKDFFGGPTIAQQAEKLSHRSRSYEQGRITGPVGLTAVQRWFFDNPTGDINHFNQSVMLRWSGRVDTGLLQQAVAGVVLAKHFPEQAAGGLQLPVAALFARVALARVQQQMVPAISTLWNLIFTASLRFLKNQVRPRLRLLQMLQSNFLFRWWLSFK